MLPDGSIRFIPVLLLPAESEEVGNDDPVSNEIYWLWTALFVVNTPGGKSEAMSRVRCHGGMTSVPILTSPGLQWFVNMFSCWRLCI